MAFDLFGLLPDPDEAAKNAPQLKIDDSRLKQLRTRLTGLSPTREANMRNKQETALNTSATASKLRVENSTANPATAIAEGAALDKQLAQNRSKGERFIRTQDLKLEQEARNRYGQEYANIQQKENENKLAREEARNRADAARKGALGNIIGKVAGAGLSFVLGPAGPLAGKEIGDVVSGGLTKDNKKKALRLDKKLLQPKDPSSQKAFPISDTHTVRYGESLGSIADLYGLHPKQLQSWNPWISKANPVRVGSVLNTSPLFVNNIDTVNASPYSTP